MHQHKYDLDRFTLAPWDDLDATDAPMTPSAKERATHRAFEEAEHKQFVAIMNWLQALCDHGMGVELVFAPDHIYRSCHMIDEQSWQEQWLVLFYENTLFADDVGPDTEASFGLHQQLQYDGAGNIMTRSVDLTSPGPLTSEAEEQLYQRIVAAANAHALGNTGTVSLEEALELASSSTH